MHAYTDNGLLFNETKAKNKKNNSNQSEGKIVE